MLNSLHHYQLKSYSFETIVFYAIYSCASQIKAKIKSIIFLYPTVFQLVNVIDE